MNSGGHIPPVSSLLIVTTAKISRRPGSPTSGAVFWHDAAISDKNSRSGIDKHVPGCYTAFVI